MRATSAATCVGLEVVDRDRDPAAAGGVDELGGLLDRLRPVVLGPVLARGAPGAVDGRARLAQRDGDAAPGAPASRPPRAPPSRPASRPSRAPQVAAYAARAVVALRAGALRTSTAADHERPAGELHRAQRLAEDQEREHDRRHRLGRREDRGGRRADAPEARRRTGRPRPRSRRPRWPPASRSRSRSRRPGAGRRRAAAAIVSVAAAPVQTSALSRSGPTRSATPAEVRM